MAGSLRSRCLSSQSKYHSICRFAYPATTSPDAFKMLIHYYSFTRLLLCLATERDFIKPPAGSMSLACFGQKDAVEEKLQKGF
jgi:hypothetical protein